MREGGLTSWPVGRVAVLAMRKGVFTDFSVGVFSYI